MRETIAFGVSNVFFFECSIRVIALVFGIAVSVIVTDYLSISMDKLESSRSPHQLMKFCSTCNRQRPRLGENGRFCFKCSATEEAMIWCCDMCSNRNDVLSAVCRICGDGLYQGPGNLPEQFFDLKMEAIAAATASVISKLNNGRIEEASVEYKRIIAGNISRLTPNSKKELKDTIREKAGTVGSLFPGLFFGIECWDIGRKT